MSRPGILTSKKETRYTLYWALNVPLGRSCVPLHLNYLRRLNKWLVNATSRPFDPQERETVPNLLLTQSVSVSKRCTFFFL